MKRKWLAVGIILLFIGTTIIPTAAQKIEKSSSSNSRGNWLYVGGSGPGNYSWIQDAIDNASDGDTVFVYAYSSPYPINGLKIEKSISLIGENKTSTEIVGITGINIFADKVNISGFHIWICPVVFGIRIFSNFNSINDNIISDISEGNPILLHSYSSNNSIFNNIIKNCGVFLMEHENNHNKICRNLIINSTGLSLGHSNNNLIYENWFVQCQNGILLQDCTGNQIIRNTFLFNSRDAYFKNSFFNTWLGNYWQRPRILPKVVFGLFSRLYMHQTLPFEFPIFRFDIRPAFVPIYIQSVDEIEIHQWDLMRVETDTYRSIFYC